MLKKPFWLYVLSILMVVMGAMAILGGGLLSIKPNGTLMKIPVTDLAHTPFKDFLIPGLFLLIVLGILPMFLAYALFKQPNWTIFKKLNLYSDLAWPWSWAVYYGLLLILWIIIEVQLVGYHTIVQGIVAV